MDRCWYLSARAPRNVTREFQTPSHAFNIDRIHVKMQRMPNPEGCLGYRLESVESALEPGTDSTEVSGGVKTRADT